MGLAQVGGYDCAATLGQKVSVSHADKKNIVLLNHVNVVGRWRSQLKLLDEAAFEDEEISASKEPEDTEALAEPPTPPPEADAPAEE